MSIAGAPEVISLGCRLNIAESETIRALLAGHYIHYIHQPLVRHDDLARRAAFQVFLHLFARQSSSLDLIFGRFGRDVRWYAEASSTYPSRATSWGRARG